MSADPTPDRDVRHARNDQVLWRLAPDRVLVRRPWPLDGQDEAVDFLGLAAMIWLVLDEPGTVDDIEERLVDARGSDDRAGARDDVVDTLDQLVATGWVEATAG